MKTNFLIPLLAFFLCGSCGSNLEKHLTVHVQEQGKIQKANPFRVSIQSGHISIDSVHYFYAGERVKNTKDSVTNLILSFPLGKNKLKAKVFTPKGIANLYKTVILHNNVAPEVYGYKIINTYPHDPTAFTQGLEFYGGSLYESTGKYGSSSVREVDLQTGEIIQKFELKKKYFAEGLTILNDKLYLLTWRAGKGFIFNPKTLKKIGSFPYGKSEKGWGLCNNGKYLYKSDGTAKIWRLNGKTLEEEGYIQPVTNSTLSTRFNELEWVNGKIYANTWQKAGVAMINPKTGAIEGVIDFRGLKEKLGNTARANVLNGIAYDEKSDKLYITGKYWDKIFQVKIIK